MIICVPCAARAGVSVDIKIDRHEISLVDSVRLVVTVSGTRSSGSPRIKGLEDFSVDKGGTSTQMKIINGSYSSSVEHTYYLQPKKVGEFRIGPAVVEVDGRVYSSGTEGLSVKKSSAQAGHEDEPVFLRAELSSKKVYVEEQALYILKLYYIADISNISLSSIPETEGLAFRQLGKHITYRTVYNKRNYNVIELRFAVIPEKAGKYNLFPAKMSMAVRGRDRRRSRDPFDDFFNMRRGRTITVASDPLSLEVLPVPEKGKPADFAGLIGDFTISSSLSPLTIKAGESATLTITVRGIGNVNRIQDISMPAIENLKIYSDEPVLETEQSDRGIEGIKVMKWAIVPEREGRYNIPPVSVSYFNTEKEMYDVIKSRPYQLSVLPGTGVEDAISALDKKYSGRAEKNIVEQVGRDILPIHSSISGLSPGSDKYSGWIFLLLLFFPVFMYAGLITARRISEKSPEQIAREESARAAKTFCKKIGKTGLTASDVSEALRDYINRRFNLNLGLLTPDDAARILAENGCAEGTVKEMEGVVRELENAIYTGKGENIFKTDTNPAKLVSRIEKEIKRS